MGTPLLTADVDALVAAFVRPGMHLHLAATMSRPNALTNAVCRVLRERGNLTVSTTAVHSSAHALALSGAVRHVVTCFLGDTYPTPRPNPLYREVFQGKPFSVESWSLLSQLQRLVAAATGQPWAVTTSLVGSDLAVGKPETLRVIDPPEPSGRGAALLRPLAPDLTLVHGVCADRHGNVVLCAPVGEGAWPALAARQGVLASVERIVPDEVIATMTDRVVIPGNRVLGLCEARFGAHPQSLRTGGLAGVPGYRDDYAFMEEIVRACAGGRGDEWFSRRVTGPRSHAGYLADLGDERLASLILRDGDTTGSRVAEPPAGEGDTLPRSESVATQVSAKPSVTPQERLVVLGARAIADLVRGRGYDTLLAGIGTSHMAAWLAAHLLRQEGRDLCVAAELGLVGMDPEPGDVYLFSQLHAARSRQLCGIPEVLGALVAGNARCLGVLSAAELDELGNINTTRLPDGRWVTGSGGANDIASTTDCLVVAPASPRRYVSELAYRTSPGDRVVEVASQLGRFRREGPGGPFVLATWAEAGAPNPDPACALRSATSWTPRVGPDLAAEREITPQEIDWLRRMDPEGRYR